MPNLEVSKRTDSQVRRDRAGRVHRSIAPVIAFVLLQVFGIVSLPAAAATVEPPRVLELLSDAVLERAVDQALSSEPTPRVELNRRSFTDDEAWIFELLQGFYRDRDHRPVFTDATGLSAAGTILVAQLEQSWRHGIIGPQLQTQESAELIRILRTSVEDPDVRALLLQQSELATLYRRLAEDTDFQLAAGLIAPRGLSHELLTQADGRIRQTLQEHPEAERLIATRKLSAASELESELALGLIRLAVELHYGNPNASPVQPALDEARALLTSRGYYEVVSGGPPPLRIPESTDELVLTPEEWRLDGLDMLLARSVGGFFLEEAITALVPSSSEYAQLQAALERYHELAEAGGWPRLPAHLDLQTPDDAARLRSRLEIEGYVEAGEPLEASLERYQRAHQLQPTGQLDRYTLLSLNISVQERIAQLALSLEGLRLAPWRGHEEQTHVRVNIPGFYATLHHGGQETLRWNVVVGKIRGNGINYTPVFSSLITEMELNPNWYPPRRLQPSGSGDRVIVPHGPNNPMGEVKFLFPNEHFVYMHDTNRPELLQAPWRPWSAGCIRVDGARQLAAHLLAIDRDLALSDAQARIEDALSSSRRERIYLREAIPVHLNYRSAWVAPSGEVHFGLDLYGADRERMNEHIAWLEARYPQLEAERPADREARLQLLVQRPPGLASR